MKRLCIAIVLLAFAAPAMADPKEEVAALIKQLQDKDEVVRLKAAKSLEKMGADAKDAIPALTEAENDADDDVKSVARRAIGKIREAMSQSDKDAVKALLAGLQKDVRSNDKDTQGQAVAGLAKLLKNDDELIRAQAARALGDAGDAAKSATKELDQAAKDPDPTVRKEARKVLDALETSSANAAKAAIQEKLAPLMKSLKETKPAAKQKALEALADMGPDAADASEAILAVMTDKSPGLQQAAMDALEKVNPSLHKPVLTLFVDRDQTNKMHALAELGKMGPDAKAAVPTLLRFYQYQLNTPDPNIFPPVGAYSVSTLAALNSIDPDNKDFHDILLSAASAPPNAAARGRDGQTKLEAIAIASSLVKGNHLDAAKVVKPLRQAVRDRFSRVAAITALAISVRRPKTPCRT